MSPVVVCCPLYLMHGRLDVFPSEESLAVTGIHLAGGPAEQAGL